MEEEDGLLQKQPDGLQQPFTRKELRCRLYKLLLEKYGELINEREKRTIGEIKALVNGEDLTILSVLSDLKPEGYSFEKDFPQVAEKAFKFVTSEIRFVDPEININYWLSPTEIFSAKVADDEDLAVFLCSVFLALGDKNASILICELDNLRTHAVVVTELHEAFTIFDPSQKHDFNAFTGPQEEVLQKYAFNGARIKRFLYKFNSELYEQFI